MLGLSSKIYKKIRTREGYPLLLHGILTHKKMVLRSNVRLNKKMNKYQ